MAIGRNTRAALKWGCYVLVLLLLFGIQSSPALFALWGVKPALVVPFAVSAALFENEAGSGALGLLAGLLWDLSAGKLFGFFGMVLMICCVCVSLLSMYFVKVNVSNSIILASITGFLCMAWDFLFYYLIWGYDQVWLCLLPMLFSLLYTAAVTAPVYFLVRWIAGRFNTVVRA